MDNMSRMIVMLPALAAYKVIHPKYYKQLKEAAQHSHLDR